MWQRVLGLSDKTEDSSSPRRKEETRSQRKGTGSVVSSSSTRKQSQGDDRDRGINPNSTSYSSSSRSPYPGGAAPSVASSYATAQAHRSDDRVKEPDLVRSSSLADNMPRTRSDRDDRSRDGEKSRKDMRRRERSSSRDRKGHGRNRSRSEEREGKTEKKERKIKRRSTEDFAETSRSGELDRFNAQTGAPGFSQFPGQFDSGPSNRPDASQALPHLSDHVPDMFPGQFPSGATAPYRPPVAKNEGGPGLASEYYGDAGQSVEHQPGVRMHSPNLIVGSEPHLMMASAEAAPPPEPSSMGQEGSAAAFWNTEATFQTPNTSPRPAPQSGPTPHGAPYITQGALSPGLPPQSYSAQSISISPNTSMNAVPTAGATATAAAGVAAGYAINHQSSSHQISHVDSYQGFAPQELPGADSPLPPSSSARPPRPGKYSSSNIPFAATAAGAAGLAAATYQHHQHYQNNQHHQGSHQYSSGSYNGNMAQKHRHEGPFAKLVDFFKDPEGVAQFEEYTEYIGVCRGCFDPTSSPRDAPRRHHHRKRRSSEKLRANTRVDKENRYYVSSDGEGKRRSNKKSWLAATAAGVGLARVGKSIFGNPNDFQDTYSVKSGRYNESTTSLPRRSSPPNSRRIYAEGESRRREDSSAYQKVHYGVAADGGVFEKSSRRPTESDTVITTYVDRDDREVRKERRRSRSRSRNRDHKFRNAAIGAAAGAAFASAVPRKRTPSPDQKVLRVRHGSQQRSPERRSRRARQSPEPSPGIIGGFFSSGSPKRQSSSKKRKQKGGFFSLGNASSSSSDADRGQVGYQRRSVTKRKTSPKIKSDAEAKAALIGLGTAAAALAAHESRSKNKQDRIPNLVAVKDTRGKHKHHGDGKHDSRRGKPRADSLEEEDLWESASEDEGYSSVDSALAFGISRHGSRESLAGSGTEKWDWRWGNKKPRRPSKENLNRPYLPSGTEAAAAGITGAVVGGALSRDSHRDSAMQSTGSLPSMKHVYPVSTSDPTNYDAVKRNGVIGQHIQYSRPDPVPIQQPRPIAPVPAAVYTQSPTDAPILAPSGDTNFGYEQPPEQYPGISKYTSMPGAFDTTGDISSESRHRRRDSSPPTVVAINPKSVRSREDDYVSRSESIKDEESKRRKEYSEERRRSDRTFSEIERRELEEQEALDRERRQSKRDSRSRDEDLMRDHDRNKVESEEPSRRKRRSTVFEEDKQSDRHAEIERELRRLAQEEQPASKPRKEAGNHAVEYAIAGAAIGATVAAVAHKSAKSNEKRRERRDSPERYDARMDAESGDEFPSRKRSSKANGGFAGLVGAMMDGEKGRGRKFEDEPVEIIEPPSNDPEDYNRQTSTRDRRSQERDLARRAAGKVRIARSPSPAPHESYASYFAPDDILSKPAGEKEKVVDPTTDVHISVEPPRSHGGYVEPEIPFRDDPEIIPVDARRNFPWTVPPLNLIYPTPLPSRASSRANSVVPSPVIQPQDSTDEAKEEKSETPRKVSFEEEHQTHEYEVVTPEDHREEFITSRSKENGVTSISKADSPKSIVTAADIESPVEEIPRRSMPGVFDDDPEFVATLAAGAEAAGFDPEIVIDDPIYRRRDSPPGSQERREFYAQPFYETVSDIAMDSPRSRGAPPQRGWVEDGELPETPRDGTTQPISEAGSKESDPDTSRKARRKREKAAKRNSTDNVNDEVDRKPTASIERSIPFDPDDAELEIIEDAAQAVPAEDEFVSSKSKKLKKKKSKKGAQEDWEDTLRGSQDIDESYSTQTQATAEEGQSTVSAARSAETPEEEEIYDSPNEYAASAVSAPVDDNRGGKKSKKKKRRSTGFDDSASTVSSPAKFDDSKESTAKSKKKGGLFGLFGKSSENVSDKPASDDMPAEATDEFEIPKKKGKKSRKSRDNDEYYNAASESVTDVSRVSEDLEGARSGKDRKAEKRRSRQDSKDGEDRGRQSQDLPDKNEEPVEIRSADLEDKKNGVPRKTQDKSAEPLSFLGMRQEEAKPPDPRRNTEDPGGGGYFSHRRSTSSPPSPSTPSKSELDEFIPSTHSPNRSRRLSMLQTEATTSPATPSPTAIPLIFRRPPSAGLTRSTSATPLASPALTTPRTRRQRPNSTEFRTNEFRPLWLLERHQSKQDFDPEEILPSLPSSHSGSRASSTHETERLASEKDDWETKFKGEPLDIGAAKDYQEDVLDSQQTTPTAASFKAESDRLLREKHKEREEREKALIEQANQDQFARELEWNERQKQDSHRRPKSDDSSSTWKEVGLAALAGTAAAVAFAPSRKHHDSHDEKKHSRKLQDTGTNYPVDESSTHHDELDQKTGDDAFISRREESLETERDAPLQRVGEYERSLPTEYPQTRTDEGDSVPHGQSDHETQLNQRSQGQNFFNPAEFASREVNVKDADTNASADPSIYHQDAQDEVYFATPASNPESSLEHYGSDTVAQHSVEATLIPSDQQPPQDSVVAVRKTDESQKLPIESVTAVNEPGEERAAHTNRDLSDRGVEGEKEEAGVERSSTADDAPKFGSDLSESITASDVPTQKSSKKEKKGKKGKKKQSLGAFEDDLGETASSSTEPFQAEIPSENYVMPAAALGVVAGIAAATAQSPFDLQPESIALPVDDDLDLAEPEIDASIQVAQGLNEQEISEPMVPKEEQEASRAEPVADDQPSLAREPTNLDNATDSVAPQEVEGSKSYEETVDGEFSVQPQEADEDEFAFIPTKKSKKGKKGKKGQAALSQILTEREVSQNLNDKTKDRNIEDEDGFPSAKEAVVAQSASSEVDEITKVLTKDDEEPTSLNVTQITFDQTEPAEPPSEDERASFSKKKNKKGKKSQFRSSPIVEDADIPGDSVTQVELTLGINQPSIEEQAVTSQDKVQPIAEAENDEWGSSSKKKGKKGKKQKSLFLSEEVPVAEPRDDPLLGAEGRVKNTEQVDTQLDTVPTAAPRAENDTDLNDAPLLQTDSPDSNLETPESSRSTTTQGQIEEPLQETQEDEWAFSTKKDKKKGKKAKVAAATAAGAAATTAFTTASILATEPDGKDQPADSGSERFVASNGAKSSKHSPEDLQVLDNEPASSTRKGKKGKKSKQVAADNAREPQTEALEESTTSQPEPALDEFEAQSSKKDRKKKKRKSVTFVDEGSAEPESLSSASDPRIVQPDEAQTPITEDSVGPSGSPKQPAEDRPATNKEVASVQSLESRDVDIPVELSTEPDSAEHSLQSDSTPHDTPAFTLREEAEHEIPSSTVNIHEASTGEAQHQIDHEASLPHSPAEGFLNERQPVEVVSDSTIQAREPEHLTQPDLSKEHDHTDFVEALEHPGEQVVEFHDQPERPVSSPIEEKANISEDTPLELHNQEDYQSEQYEQQATIDESIREAKGPKTSAPTKISEANRDDEVIVHTSSQMFEPPEPDLQDETDSAEWSFSTAASKGKKSKKKAKKNEQLPWDDQQMLDRELEIAPKISGEREKVQAGAENNDGVSQEVLGNLEVKGLEPDVPESNTLDSSFSRTLSNKELKKAKKARKSSAFEDYQPADETTSPKVLPQLAESAEADIANQFEPESSKPAELEAAADLDRTEAGATETGPGNAATPDDSEFQSSGGKKKKKGKKSKAFIWEPDPITPTIEQTPTETLAEEPQSINDIDQVESGANGETSQRQGEEIEQPEDTQEETWSTGSSSKKGKKKKKKSVSWEPKAQEAEAQAGRSEMLAGAAASIEGEREGPREEQVTAVGPEDDSFAITTQKGKKGKKGKKNQWFDASELAEESAIQDPIKLDEIPEDATVTPEQEAQERNTNELQASESILLDQEKKPPTFDAANEAELDDRELKSTTVDSEADFDKEYKSEPEQLDWRSNEAERTRQEMDPVVEDLGVDSKEPHVPELREDTFSQPEFYTQESTFETREPDIIEYERSTASRSEGVQDSEDHRIAVSKAEQEEFEQAMAEMNQGTDAAIAISDSQPAIASNDQMLSVEGQERDNASRATKSEIQKVEASNFDGHQEAGQRDFEYLAEEKTAPNIDNDEGRPLHHSSEMDEENIRSGIEETAEPLSYNADTVADTASNDWEGFAKSKKGKKSKRKSKQLAFDEEPAVETFDPDVPVGTVSKTSEEPAEASQGHQEASELARAASEEGARDGASTSQADLTDRDSTLVPNQTTFDELARDNEEPDSTDISSTLGGKGKKGKKGKRGKASSWADAQEPENPTAAEVAPTATLATAGAAALDTISSRESDGAAKEEPRHEQTSEAPSSKDTSEDQHASRDAEVPPSLAEPDLPSTSDFVTEPTDVENPQLGPTVEAESLVDPIPTKKGKKGKKSKNSQTFSWDDPATPETESTYSAEQLPEPSQESTITSPPEEDPFQEPASARKSKKGKKKKSQFIAWEEPEEQQEAKSNLGTGLETSSKDQIAEESEVSRKEDIKQEFAAEGTSDMPKESQEDLETKIIEDQSDRRINSEQNIDVEPQSVDDPYSPALSKKGKKGKKSKKQQSWEPEEEVPSMTQVQESTAESYQKRRHSDPDTTFATEQPAEIIDSDRQIDNGDAQLIDEPFVTSTSKKGKKGKKSKKQESWEPEPEASVDLSGGFVADSYLEQAENKTPSIEALSSNASAHHDEAIEVPREIESLKPGSIDTQEADMILPTADTQGQEEEFWGFATKKSKKGKRGKKARLEDVEKNELPQELSEAKVEEPSSNQYDSRIPGEPIDINQEVTFTEESAPLPEGQESVEISQWEGFAPTKKKKGKKGKKQSTFVEDDAEVDPKEPSAAGFLNDKSKSIYEEPTAFQSSEHVEKDVKGFPAYEDSGKALSTIPDYGEGHGLLTAIGISAAPVLLRHEDSLVPSQMRDVEAARDAYFETSTQSNKKGKKDKKKRKSTGLAELEEEQQVYELPVPESSVHDGLFSKELRQSEKIKEPSPSQEEEAERRAANDPEPSFKTAQAEDEWSVPVSKKAEQPKKERQESSHAELEEPLSEDVPYEALARENEADAQGLYETRDPTEVAALAEESRQQFSESPVRSPAAVPEDDWVATNSKKGKKSKRSFTAFDAGAEDTEVDNELTREAAEASVAPQIMSTEAQKEWPTSVSKKEKKGKKSKLQSSTPIDYDDRQGTPTEEQAGQKLVENFESPLQTAEVEDEWAPPKSKKGKKGKKSQRQSSATFDITDEAPVSFNEQIVDRSKDDQIADDGPVESHSRSSSIRNGAKAAGAVGAGIALFEGLHRAASVTEDQQPNQRYRRSSNTRYEDTTVFEEEKQVESDPDFDKSAPGVPVDTRHPIPGPDIDPSYRDSALHMDSPMVPEPSHRYDTVRDSGFQDEPSARNQDFAVSVEADPNYRESISRHDQSATSNGQHFEESEPQLPSPVRSRSISPRKGHDDHEPSPVHSTSKDRSATLFGSSPSTRNDYQPSETYRSIDEVAIASPEHPKSIFGGPTGYSSDRDVDVLKSPPRTPIDLETPNRPLTTIEEGSPEDSVHDKKARRDSEAGQSDRSLGGARRSITPQSLLHHHHRRVRSPNTDNPRRLGLISTDDVLSKLSWPEVDEESHTVDLERSLSRNTSKERKSSSRQRPPSLAMDPSKNRRSTSGGSIRSNDSINAIIRSPPLSASGTPPLRRVDRSLSSDLRAAHRRDEPKTDQSLGSLDETDPVKSERRAKSGAAVERKLESSDFEGVASSSSHDPAKDKGKSRAANMADVYEGYGDFHGSPRSPTRPPSMRRRQSMQILEMESRLDQLLSENRSLVDAKNRAERNLDQAVHDHSQKTHALNKALETRDLYLQQKDEELEKLRRSLQGFQAEVGRLTEANRSLGEPTNVNEDFEQRYQDLENEHHAAREQLEEQSHELEELRHKHTSLSGGMEGIVAAEVALAVQNKDAELKQLRDELETAKQQVRALQKEIMAARRGADNLVEHDEDYFDAKCEQLCKHVQQWVMRFSKFSDAKICRRMGEIGDEKITDRFDNAILDGTDVDLYLADRVKRRDVFMSVVMSMIWEFVFTRYLFGMDREQRQKLKYLEKTLSEVGSASAVNKWRATTLTMLAKRDSFMAQRQQDTEAVLVEIYNTLSAFLPPPSQFVDPLQESLRRVLSSAVDLSIEMRTQRAEYIMLPPLQPEYNTNGDLETKVYFNAASMNERSGNTADNAALEEIDAVVRIVLFPLVIKQGAEEGDEDEREVICPAQVLIAKEDSEKDRKARKSVRVMSAQGNRSQGSFAPSQMEGGYI